MTDTLKIFKYEVPIQDYFELDQSGPGSVEIYVRDSDTALFEVDIDSPKKVTVYRPQEDWAAWVFQVFINDMAVVWDGKITGADKHIPEEGKFESFAEYVSEMTEIHNDGHYNWITTLMPREFEDIAFPDGKRLHELLKDGKLIEELVDAS